MQPTELALFRSYGRPASLADGSVLAALTTPDVDADHYGSVLHLLRPGAAPVQFTRGPRDSAPVVSPNGALVVFLRAGSAGAAQLFAMPVGGGEPFQLAAHPLGASEVTFSPDSRFIAYLASVPEPGRYAAAADDAPESMRPRDLAPPAPERPRLAADAEAPRRITSLAYRADGKGFTLDQREQIFVLELIGADGSAVDGSTPRQLTAETVTIGRPRFAPDGRRIVYDRAAGADSLLSEIALVAADSAEPGVGRCVATPEGDATKPVVVGDTVFYVGTEFAGNDFAGRTPGLWSVPLGGGRPRRLTDPETVHVDADVAEPTVVDGAVLIAVADRGSVAVRAVPIGADRMPLAALPVVIGGPIMARSFSVSGGTIAAVVASPASCGDVVIGNVSALVAGGGAAAQPLTDVSAPLRDAGIAAMTELSGRAPDGYPVHGWLVLPPEDRFPGPHPVLLNVHGGPHTAFGWGVFDEAQIYASHGYAVVLPNPRGSAGYGEAHGRAIIGALGTVDADDVLALLDAALARTDLDAQRVGVMGGSYGGFMTSWLASHAPGRFVAAISERAVNAWDSFAGSSDIGFFFADAYVGSDPEEQRRRSPLQYAADIDIPLLIVHSEQDWRCPIEQAQRLFVALKSRGHETEMLLFPGEGHELSRSGRPQHRVARFRAILDWWGRYLPVGETSPIAG